MLSDVAVRARRVPGFIRAPLVLIPLGLVIYWAISYSGPYRWLAELQLSVFGEYYVVLTGVLVGMAALLPSVMLIQVLASIWPNDAAADAAVKQDMQLEEQRIQRNIPWIFGFILLVGLLGVSGYFLVSAWRLGDSLASVDVATLESGEPPPSRYVDLQGRLLLDDAMVVSEGHGGSKIERMYIPYMSAEALDSVPRPAAAAYVEIHSSWLSRYREDLHSGSLRGILEQGGLPGMLRTQLKEGDDAKADTRWVLDYRGSPKKQWDAAAAFAAMAAFVALLLGIGWIVRRRRLAKR